MIARPLATLRGEAHVDDERYDVAGTVEAAVLTWIKAGNRQHKDWDNTTLGILRLDGSRLVIEVNSARRRKRIAKEISKRFGSTATLVETKTTDIVKDFRTDARAAAKSMNPRLCQLSRSELLRFRRSRQRGCRSIGTRGWTRRCRRSGTGRPARQPRRRKAAGDWRRSSVTSRDPRNKEHPCSNRISATCGGGWDSFEHGQRWRELSVLRTLRGSQLGSDQAAV